MKRGPQGQRRPADAVSAAVMIGQIATGQIEDTLRDPVRDYTKKAGVKGAKARAKSLTKEQRQYIAKLAAQARWKKEG